MPRDQPLEEDDDSEDGEGSPAVTKSKRTQHPPLAESLQKLFYNLQVSRGRYALGGFSN